MRTFETGATRDEEDTKLDYEGFLSPYALETFAAYMHEHRIQSDGSLRDSDNWQKGIPLKVYMKSAWRHFMEWWILHRTDYQRHPRLLIYALCGLIFNAMGYLHEITKNYEYLEETHGDTEDSGIEDRHIGALLDSSRDRDQSQRELGDRTGDGGRSGSCWSECSQVPKENA